MGKFHKPPAKVTFPIAVVLHLGMLLCAGIVAVAALLQPVLLILGRISGGAGQAALNFVALAAIAVALVATDRLMQKIAVWLQP